MRRSISMRSAPALACLMGYLASEACGADDPVQGATTPVGGGGATAGASGGIPGAGLTPSAPEAGAMLPTSPEAGPPPGSSITLADAGGPCQQLTIDNGRVTPDILIVLDRSSSMKGQGVDRWTPSVAALKAITSELDDLMRFGLMAFPGRGASTGFLGGGMSCAAGTLEVPIAANAAPAIATSLNALTLVQSTPTATTLQAAHTVLGSGKAVLDGATAAKYVILVTDGAPNCSDGQGGGGGNDAAAVMASVNAIADMQRDGIKTFVVGYDTQNDATLKAALDQMAKAGGTGDQEHRAIENEAGLVTQLRSILGVAVDCQFTLSMAPTDPNYVSVQLDGMKISLGAADGFVLSSDHKLLTVQGASCTKLRSEKERHLLSVRVECERQTLL